MGTWLYYVAFLEDNKLMNTTQLYVLCHSMKFMAMTRVRASTSYTVSEYLLGKIEIPNANGEIF